MPNDSNLRLKVGDRVTILEPNEWAGLKGRIKLLGVRAKVLVMGGETVLVPTSELEFRERQVWVTARQIDAIKILIDMSDAIPEAFSSAIADLSALLERLA